LAFGARCRRIWPDAGAPSIAVQADRGEAPLKAKPRRPRIHITAVASSAATHVKRLGGFERMVELARQGAGAGYEVTANEKMITCRQDDLAGGRVDDEARAREVERLLADDNVAALVAIRGGAWFVRILDRIHFDVLARRKTTIHIFGFSEMTTLIDIAGQYPKVVALYDLCPAFLCAGIEESVLRNPEPHLKGMSIAAEQMPGFAAGYALARFPQEFSAFFGDVVSILEGNGSCRVPTGTVLGGTLAAEQKIRITGGCLSVLVALLGTQYAKAIETAGKWLALEDVNESPDPIDRMMAAIKLNGLFERAEGVILGRFFDHGVEVSDAAYHALVRNLPAGRRIPVIRLENLGHVYPIAPLPMHREVTLRCARGGKGPARVTVDIPWSRWGRR
jgi:muramoyltetrapeptide carboxypeptidase LdcA involved in peptidoglycan recycling